MAKVKGVKVAECPKCHTPIGDKHSNTWCTECGNPLPPEIKILLPELPQLYKTNVPKPAEENPQSIQPQTAQASQVTSIVPNPNYADTSSINFLRAIGWIDLVVGIIAAIIIFANATKTAPGEYLPYTRVQLADKEVTDPFAIALAVAVAFQGITAAILFSVIASLAENVIAIRKQVTTHKENTS
ncbi:MAG: hypothetical protein WKF74_11285 [Pyrinomonadaceae bacterium]